MKERIITSQDVLFGKPRIKGTRISVEQILSCLEEGYTVEKIIKEFPEITKEDVRACIKYANSLVVNIHMISVKPSNGEIFNRSKHSSRRN